MNDETGRPEPRYHPEPVAGPRAASSSSSGADQRPAADYTAADVTGMLQDRMQQAYTELGRFNLAVFGRTGAGKSTLINAIFGAEVAATGIGAPVTTGLSYHLHPSGYLGLYDSEGFETGQAGDAIVAALQHAVRSRRALPMSEQIHAVWYVVRSSDLRFERSQGDFVRSLAELGLPVILVLAQVPSRDGQVHPAVAELAAHIESLRLPIRPDGRVIATNAVADSFHGTPAFGLSALLDATYAVVPEVVEQALTAAQVLDLGRKRAAARTVINKAVAVAAGIGATPIPFADAALLIPAQTLMIARITAAYGLPPRQARAAAIAGAAALTTGATMAGKSLVTGILKLIPGAGTVTGSTISATVAGTLTKAVGWAWAQVCEHVLALPAEERARFLTGPGARDLFVSVLRSRGRDAATGLGRN
ncbi:MAG: DUF697 domain-containing protein [Actinomycetota bacterium]|nr:MAG: DUF697 domain-containing protein [Actinomycetota bacterium]